MSLTLSPDQTLLFIGDSITDCGRRQDPAGLGTGYVRIIHHHFACSRPQHSPRILNTGISGHKVTDLAARWKTDVLDQRPAVLSVKIGVNDVWHALRGRNAGVPLETFETVYRDLLAQFKKACPDSTLVLCQPTVIWEPAPSEGNPLLQDYAAVVGKLAAETGAILVPLRDAFEQARSLRPDIDWAPDGVHPGPAGHLLIARTWLTATGLL